MTNEGMTTAPKNVIPVIPCDTPDVIPPGTPTLDKPLADNTTAKHKGVTNQGVTDKALPGEPVPQGWEDWISDNLERTGNIEGIPRRGKDIKCFTDLPLDVQLSIERSCPDIVKDYEERCRRTAAAIRYQHLFPDRYHSTTAVCTGTVTGKPGDVDYDGICTPEWRAARGR